MRAFSVSGDVPSNCYPDVRAVLRAFSSSVLSLLVTITLFWGGCISCPQFFMFPTAERSAKRCCNKAGKCERPEKGAPEKECKRMPLEPPGFASAHADLAAVVLTADIVPVAPSPTAPGPERHPETGAVAHSPPDLNVLHSTFLI